LEGRVARRRRAAEGRRDRIFGYVVCIYRYAKISLGPREREFAWSTTVVVVGEM
jgi:hypothetical protein